MTALINAAGTRQAVVQSGAWIRVELTPQAWQRFQWEPTDKRVAVFYEQLHDWYRRRALLLDNGEDVR